MISRAETVVADWMSRHYPRMMQRYSLRSMLEMRQQVAIEYPEMVHDLSFLRRQVFLRMARATGYDDTVAEEAFSVFFAARNEVTLFDDVVPALRRLSARLPLFALSNGNADLELIGIATVFSGTYSARQFGVAKPDPRIFHEMAQRAGFSATDILHVGDDPQNDIDAAAAAGMPTVWINRNGDAWPAHLTPADHEITDLHQLESWLD